MSDQLPLFIPRYIHLQRLSGATEPRSVASLMPMLQGESFSQYCAFLAQALNDQRVREDASVQAALFAQANLEPAQYFQQLLAVRVAFGNLSATSENAGNGRILEPPELLASLERLRATIIEDPQLFESLDLIVLAEEIYVEVARALRADRDENDEITPAHQERRDADNEITPSLSAVLVGQRDRDPASHQAHLVALRRAVSRHLDGGGREAVLQVTLDWVDSALVRTFENETPQQRLERLGAMVVEPDLRSITGVTRALVSQTQETPVDLSDRLVNLRSQILDGPPPDHHARNLVVALETAILSRHMDETSSAYLRRLETIARKLPDLDGLPNALLSVAGMVPTIQLTEDPALPERPRLEATDRAYGVTDRQAAPVSAFAEGELDAVEATKMFKEMDSVEPLDPDQKKLALNLANRLLQEKIPGLTAEAERLGVDTDKLETGLRADVGTASKMFALAAGLGAKAAALEVNNETLGRMADRIIGLATQLEQSNGLSRSEDEMSHVGAVLEACGRVVVARAAVQEMEATDLVEKAEALIDEAVVLLDEFDPSPPEEALDESAPEEALDESTPEKALDESTPEKAPDGIEPDIKAVRAAVLEAKAQELTMRAAAAGLARTSAAAEETVDQHEDLAASVAQFGDSAHLDTNLRGLELEVRTIAARINALKTVLDDDTTLTGAVAIEDIRDAVRSLTGVIRKAGDGGSRPDNVAPPSKQVEEPEIAGEPESADEPEDDARQIADALETDSRIAPGEVHARLVPAGMQLTETSQLVLNTAMEVSAQAVDLFNRILDEMPDDGQESNPSVDDLSEQVGRLREMAEEIVAGSHIDLGRAEHALSTGGDRGDSPTGRHSTGLQTVRGALQLLIDSGEADVVSSAQSGALTLLVETPTIPLTGVAIVEAARLHQSLRSSGDSEGAAAVYARLTETEDLELHLAMAYAEAHYGDDGKATEAIFPVLMQLIEGHGAGREQHLVSQFGQAIRGDNGRAADGFYLVFARYMTDGVLAQGDPQIGLERHLINEFRETSLAGDTETADSLYRICHRYIAEVLTSQSPSKGGKEPTSVNAQAHRTRVELQLARQAASVRSRQSGSKPARAQ